ALTAQDVVAELPPRRVEQHGWSRLRPKSGHRPHTLHCDGHPRYLPLKLKEYSIPKPMECCESLNPPLLSLNTSWSEKSPRYSIRHSRLSSAFASSVTVASFSVCGVPVVKPA